MLHMVTQLLRMCVHLAYLNSNQIMTALQRTVPHKHGNVSEGKWLTWTLQRRQGTQDNAADVAVLPAAYC